MSDADGLTSNGARQIPLGGGRRAWLTMADETDPGKLLISLRLGPQKSAHPVIVVSGSAEALDDPARRRTEAGLASAVASAAVAAHAAVVDHGRNTGLVAAIGRALARRVGTQTALLGVAPRGKVSWPDGPQDGRVALEPHHSHFILADATEWGGETPLLLDVANKLAHGGPVVMVLAGADGPDARAEVLEAVRRGWPVFIIDDVGGLAQRISRKWRSNRAVDRGLRRTSIVRRYRRVRQAVQEADEDADLEEIVQVGDIRLFTQSESRRLGQQLAWELVEEPVLKDAWGAFATYDLMARRARATFQWLQSSILTLGVVATLLALIQYELGGPSGQGVLHWLVVIVPVLMSALIAWSSRRADGRRWIMLRAAAEAVKAEIYRYRTRTEVYCDEPEEGRRDEPADHPQEGRHDEPADRPQGSRHGKPATATSTALQMRMLQAHLAAIDARLVRTEASMAPLTPYGGPLPPEMSGAGGHDNGLSLLDAKHYLQIRIEDQIRYYHQRIRHLHQLRTLLELLAIAAGGAGAIVAAFGVEVWVGLTSAISTSALAYLGYLQVENSIIAYNRTASRLASLARSWHAHGPHQREDPAALRQLVMDTEDVLHHERAGWVHQMCEALQELKDSQAAAAERVRSSAQMSSPSAGNEAPE